MSLYFGHHATGCLEPRVVFFSRWTGVRMKTRQNYWKLNWPWWVFFFFSFILIIFTFLPFLSVYSSFTSQRSEVANSCVSHVSNPGDSNRCWSGQPGGTMDRAEGKALRFFAFGHAEREDSDIFFLFSSLEWTFPQVLTFAPTNTAFIFHNNLKSHRVGVKSRFKWY